MRKVEEVGLQERKGKKEYPCCVFSVDIHIDKVMEATKTILVSRVRGRKFSANYIFEWSASEWTEASGCPIEIQTLAWGWFMLKFEKREHLEWVLEMNWNFGKRPIQFRKWTPLFNAQREKIEDILV